MYVIIATLITPDDPLELPRGSQIWPNLKVLGHRDFRGLENFEISENLKLKLINAFLSIPHTFVCIER